MNTVVAADTFMRRATPGHGDGHARAAARPSTTSSASRPDTPAFKVDMTGGGPAGAGAIRFLRWHPFGLGIDSNAVSNCYNGAPGGCTTGSPTSRTVTNPQAGVWEVTVDARRNSDAVQAPFTLTASILGATRLAEPRRHRVGDDRRPGRQVVHDDEPARCVHRAGRRHDARQRRDRHARRSRTSAQQQFPVTVTAGSTSLRATIGSPSDPAADLDLFVFNCTTGTCVLAGQSADGDSEESVTIANPAAGNWIVLVDGFDVPAGTTTYNYVDVFANAAFGAGQRHRCQRAPRRPVRRGRCRAR